jgi:P-type Ca2+ transporter type 2C
MAVAGLESVSRAAWSLPGVEVARYSGTDVASGLSQAEADVRLVRAGPNEVARRVGPPLWRRIAGQLADTMILVLLAAAVLTAVVGDLADTVVIVAVIAVNTTIGVSQEIRASRAIAALSTLTAPSARVVRDARERAIPASEVVPGDLLRLAAGDVVCADARLVRTESLDADESALTGESVPVGKAANAVHPADTPLADRTGMVHAGTVITRGRAEAVVTATGADSALGAVVRLLDERRSPLTPLQRRLARLGRQLSLAAAVLCLLVAALGVLRGEPLEQMAVTAISLAVAAIPESLPAVVSLSLALGAQRMARRGALIRQLPAVETLGSVTVIASDKTGTLTEGVMAVGRAWTPAAEVALSGQGYSPSGDVQLLRPEAGDVPQDVLSLLRAGALCNDARLLAPGGTGDWAADGDPTEAALLAAAARAGLDLDQLQADYPRVAELPFDAARARMSTAHRDPTGRLLVICKGAPEVVLNRALVTDTSEVIAAFRAMAEAYAVDGFRVLAVATGTRDDTGTGLERDLQLAGLVALTDPIRPAAGPAVEAARSAGIIPVLITGDHPATAATVAQRLGILTTNETVLTGRELAANPTARAPVYARTAPEQKLDIVTSWQSDGHVVAMTGDGVNDAPALRVADIGVAMGRRGTEVAKQAADLVLTDDDFATVVAAVEEGRRVYDNIRRFVRYGLAGGMAEILVMLAGPFLGLGVTLLPAQILWINLLTHGVPGVALGVEPAESDVLTRPPRRPNEGVLSGGLLGQVARLGFVLGAASLAAGVWAHGMGGHWQSVLFATLALGQLWTALAVGAGVRNRFLLVAVAVDAVLVPAALYLPPLQALLRTEPLTPIELGVVLAVSILGAVYVRVERRLRAGIVDRSPPVSA